MKKKQLKLHKFKDYSPVAFTLFFVSFLIIFAVRPAVTTIVQLHKERQDFGSIDKTLQKKIEQVIDAQSNYMSVVQYVSDLDQTLPNQQNLEDTKLLLKSKSVTINTFNIGSTNIVPIPQSELAPITISTSVTGTYSDLLNYLKMIKKQKRIYTIEEFTISPGESTNSAELVGTVVINTYFYNLP